MRLGAVPDRTPFATPDPLGEALHVLRLTGAFYCRSELTEPWALTMPAWEDCLVVHVVLTGRCWLEIDGSEPVALVPGELVVVPHGRGHVVRGAQRALAPPVVDLPHDWVSDRYAILRYGGTGEPSALLCAIVRFDHPAARALVALLPSVLHLRADHGAGPDWLQRTLALVTDEARERRPGGEAVLTRLSDVLVVQAIRAWLELAPGARTGWLGALTDVRLGRAVAAVHRDPARPWTVADLARESAMSRSAFAARFTEVVGESAMAYVTRWRMSLAAEALRDPATSVGAVAGRYGYASEAAFSRAFKRIVGCPPGQVRRSPRVDPVGTRSPVP